MALCNFTGDWDNLPVYVNPRNVVLVRKADGESNATLILTNATTNDAAYSITVTETLTDVVARLDLYGRN